MVSEVFCDGRTRLQKCARVPWRSQGLNAIISSDKENFCFFGFSLRISFHFRLQACVFDWAGTVCDAGVFAPGLSNISSFIYQIFCLKFEFLNITVLLFYL